MGTCMISHRDKTAIGLSCGGIQTVESDGICQRSDQKAIELTGSL